VGICEPAITLIIPTGLFPIFLSAAGKSFQQKTCHSAAIQIISQVEELQFDPGAFACIGQSSSGGSSRHGESPDRAKERRFMATPLFLNGWLSPEKVRLSANPNGSHANNSIRLQEWNSDEF
jgi:hypothetical protein